MIKYILPLLFLTTIPVYAEDSVRAYAPVETHIQKETNKIFSRFHKKKLHINVKESTGNKRYSGISLRGIKEPLKSWTFQTIRQCSGTKVISGWRKTKVKGTGSWSLHSKGLAVDIQGNPSCVAQRLKTWAGGASNDYWRIKPHHYHISWGGSEHGIRFAHR